MNPLNELNDWFDENIPDEVLQDESWSSKLLPDLDNLTDCDYTFEDMVGDEDE